MSEYSYTDRGGTRLTIANNHGETFVALGTLEPGRINPAIEVPAAERVKAAQALAGDDYEVVEKIAEWERDLLKARARVVEIAEDSWPEAVSDGLTLTCAYCDVTPRIDYRVGDGAWSRVVAKADRLGVVCLECYLARGGSSSDVEEIQVTCPGETLVLEPATIYRYRPEPELDPELDPEQVRAVAVHLQRVDEGLQMYNVVDPMAYARESVSSSRRDGR